MFTSFSTALSALNAFSTAVDVVGNNLANLNTTAYKTSVVSFHELVSQSLGGAGETQVGLGVGRPMTTRQFTQGAIQSSNGPLDIAIQGSGFLVVKKVNETAPVFTRAGNLQVDSSGYLITSSGERVQGWVPASASSSANPADIAIPSGLGAPSATSKFSVDMNLDATANTGDTFAKAIEIFDSLGSSHLATVTLTKTATANEWDYSLSIPDSDVATAIPPVTGTLTFDAQGKLQSPASTDTPPVITITGWNNGAADLDLEWDLFNTDDTPRVTQFAERSEVSASSQDGIAAARLVGVTLGDGGVVLAQYSNGKQGLLGQLAMASIRNPESLVSIGNNNFQLGADSAIPEIGLPGTGGRGSILGNSIETSTVDMAKEFTNLIVLQRGYQANSKVVMTVDEMSQETLNLKR